MSSLATPRPIEPMDRIPTVGFGTALDDASAMLNNSSRGGFRADVGAVTRMESSSVAIESIQAMFELRSSR